MLATKPNKTNMQRTCADVPDDTLMTKEKFFAKIDHALQQCEDGHCRELTPEYHKELFGW
ncbi:MAG: hypothetical protein LBB79_03155 [Prevotellaceae bacterium]|jgi:hypothetical protein|nr:hypothetical protein [Prevotellaceae bacterium]